MLRQSLVGLNLCKINLLLISCTQSCLVNTVPQLKISKNLPKPFCLKSIITFPSKLQDVITIWRWHSVPSS